MIRNVGTADRIARVAIGLVLLVVYFAGPKTPIGVVGIVPLLTGLSGWCPLYQLFGWSTCRTPSANGR